MTNMFGNTRPARPCVRIASVVVALGPLELMTGGCASLHQSVDFERHSMSTFYESRTKNDTLVFETRTDSRFPAADPAAEARRMEWLAGWLKLRNMCPNGYIVTDRSLIPAEDPNPYHNELRYEFHCTG